MEFQRVHGTQEQKPLEVECCGNVVFVRKDIKRVTVSSGEEEIEMWEYYEARANMEDFINYFAKNTSDKIEENSEGEFDLADIADENSNSIFELADYIEELEERVSALEGGD